MRPLDVTKLPREVREALGLEDDNEKKIRASDPLAQMLELRSRWNVLQSTQDDVKPGDLCIEKEGFGLAHKIEGALIYMFIEDINWDKGMHQAYMAKWAEHDFEPTDDGWFAMMLPDKNIMLIRPMTKARMRKLTPAETVGLDDDDAECV